MAPQGWAVAPGMAVGFQEVAVGGVGGAGGAKEGCVAAKRRGYLVAAAQSVETGWLVATAAAQEAWEGASGASCRDNTRHTRSRGRRGSHKRRSQRSRSTSGSCLSRTAGSSSWAATAVAMAAVATVAVAEVAEMAVAEMAVAELVVARVVEAQEGAARMAVGSCGRSR